MSIENYNPTKPIIWILIWLVIAVLFALTYTQSPLYEGNQNTKFLHGLADAGLGYLDQDWLANTVDPLPVFTYLVTQTARVSERLFYAYYALLFGVYVFSLYSISSHLYKMDKSLVKSALFLLGTFVLHSRYLIRFTQRSFGFDYEFLHSGVAGQYLLGLEFQNSVFGVFLLLSIFLFLKRHYLWSILAMVVATTFHSAYLFSAALLTISYSLLIFWENLHKHPSTPKFTLKKLLQAAVKPILLGMLMLALVLPVIWYNQTTLAASSPETWQRALDILINERIPHHSLSAVWLGPTVYIQVVLIIVGLILSIKSRLFTIMLTLFAGGLLFTIIQIQPNNYSLAALAPWRVSVLLVPLSVHLIIAAAISWIVDRLGILDSSRSALWIVSAAVLGMIILVIGGVRMQRNYGTSSRMRQANAMMDYVKSTLVPGDLYLIPPLENDLNDFRLYTGAPIVINWKSHPYKDIELLEWNERVQSAQRYYVLHQQADSLACEMLYEITQEYQITHAVFKNRSIQPVCDFMSEVYSQKSYSIYSLTL